MLWQFFYFRQLGRVFIKLANFQVLRTVTDRERVTRGPEKLTFTVRQILPSHLFCAASAEHATTEKHNAATTINDFI